MSEKTNEENGGENEATSVFDEIEDEIGRIFKNKDLLRIGHVPETEDRIVGREEEIKELAKAIYDVTRGEEPSNCLIYGKTGTGKSLVSRYVVREAKRKASENSYEVADLYVDCAEQNTHTRAVRHIARKLNEPEETGLTVPSKGIGSTEYYSYIWEILENYESVLLILDEVDKLDNDEILMQLSRAREADKTNTNLGVIAISNKLGYKDRLSERVKSSLSEREFIFDPYNANQLRAIMNKRSDAFYNDVLSESAIPLAAALSAKEHGDARKAIKILRHAGEIAEEKGNDKIRESHVRDAQKRAEKDRFQDLISGSTPQVKVILYSLASISKSQKEDSFSTGEVYDEYLRVCQKIGLDQLSENRVYELLKEQAFLGVVESKKTSGGRGRGVYLTHRLVINPEIVMEVVSEDQRFEM